MMANYQCTSCGQQFTLQQEIAAPRCPSCGQPCVELSGNGQQPHDTQNVHRPNNAYGAPHQEPGIFDDGPSGKSRGVAGLLAILLGGLGVHYFYLNKVGGGIICLILTLISCGIWSIISFVQGILMLTMKQADFERKYVDTSSTFPLF